MKAYPGPRWATKVKAMPEGQVVATFTRLRNAGKIKI